MGAHLAAMTGAADGGRAAEPDGDPWRRAMAVGDFEAAWRASDRVLARRSAADRDDPALPYHVRWVWDGRPFAGRDVLVRCYHGLGDTIQFSRFLPALRQRTRSLRVECQEALIPLLRSALPGIELVAFDVARPLPPAECDLEIMELPHALRLRPDPEPYLTVAAAPPPAARPAIGLCWRAGGWRAARSLPESSAAALVAALSEALPGCTLVSLQQGAALPGLADDCPRAVLDTARRMAGLDAVISVDTMVAHLAGAIGVPLCLLLDANADWRWDCGGRAWYRDLRCYRQRRPGEWAAPVRSLLADLTLALAPGTLRGGLGF